MRRYERFATPRFERASALQAGLCTRSASRPRRPAAGSRLRWSGSSEPATPGRSRLERPPAPSPPLLDGRHERWRRAGGLPAPSLALGGGLPLAHDRAAEVLGFRRRHRDSGLSQPVARTGSQADAPLSADASPGLQPRRRAGHPDRPLLLRRSERDRPRRPALDLTAADGARDPPPARALPLPARLGARRPSASDRRLPLLVRLRRLHGRVRPLSPARERRP